MSFCYDCLLASILLLFSHAVHVARLSRLGARSAYTTVKIPMYKIHI
jgi:hypothetical protein